MDRLRRWEAAASALCVGCLALALSAPSAVATFPGTNGRIAYTVEDPATGHPFIHTVLPSGRGDRSIGPLGLDLAWSPSGRRLAFAGLNRWYNYDIYTMRAEGDAIRRLTTDGEDEYPYGAGDPSYSPGGGRLVFGVYGYHEPIRIATMRTDGSDRRIIADEESLPGDLAGSIWSPGGEIAYHLSGGAHERESLWAMRRDGTGKHRLVNLGVGGGYGPMYSPDASKFLFVRFWRDGSVHTRLADADGTDVRPAPCKRFSTATTEPEREGLFPITYSPDGRWVLAARYFAEPRYDQNLVRVSLGSCKPQTVVRHVVAPWGADWQPLPTG